ncbi:PQQ-binding-like beta-propeller repeat protein [Flammeovirga kamogawensis]|uniref:PQQ-binding-like beta-propeller repeat protein n=1 Tax=Flammeovirga kamogawensis TaxID=373891 RepID=A0ABX8H4I5_9BACT|nr:PQQ-binding-like beta-propeller repeat protein [Flammeovirga kamogawensis]QWG10623.1 hypothetical protein KM029_24895 [Flammeovirga kamogawensis]
MILNFTLNTQNIVQYRCGQLIKIIAIICLIQLEVRAQENDFVYDFNKNESLDWTADNTSFWAIEKDPTNTIDAMHLKVISNPKLKHIYSIETGKTILNVSTAVRDKTTYIVASDFDGLLMGIDYDGNILWQNELSGYTNHDIWCEDITKDGNDEILAANADGTLYCLDHNGQLLWSYKHTEAPLFSVTVAHHDGNAYVVTGGFEMSILYINKDGGLEKEIKNTSYSVDKAWGKDVIPTGKKHINNFLKKFYDEEGSERLLVQGTHNGNAGDGTLYFFEPFEDTPYEIVSADLGKPVGGLNVVKVDGKVKVLMGTSTAVTDSQFEVYDLKDKTREYIFFPDIQKEFDRFGYRIVEPEVIEFEGKTNYLTLFGSRIFLFSTTYSSDDERKIIPNNYAFNDLFKDTQNNRLLLASAQSGGSCIHVIDINNNDWVEEFPALEPPGNIAKILDNSASVREQVASFQRPNREREPLEVYFVSDEKDEYTGPIIEAMNSNSYGAQFYANKHMPKVENWDRSAMENETYKNKRDGRKKYTLTQDEVLSTLTPLYEEGIGLNTWGGHGNDPYFYSVDTKKKLIDAAKGKRINFIYPELESTSAEFEFVMNDLLYPLAEYGKGKNLTISIRTKHLFWSSVIYKPFWSRVLSGEFSDVFVPSMEETTDKTMEISIAARMGVWSSGALDNWGVRSARDNPSYIRLRQRSHQMLPNHFLRQMVYNISCGARYINNFAVDQQYTSVLWEMVEKGVIYVPKREEIVSISPVHLSIINPTERFIHDGNRVKWLTWFDEGRKDETNMLFDRLNGSWPASPTNEWDFSRITANVKDRRLNFLPTYPNGIVLITPPQNKHFVPEELPRGNLVDHLHPLYKDILSEFISDGDQFYSADGNSSFTAPSYSATFKEEIEEKAKLLPLNVTGDVAWVAAQSDAKHLRVTLIDGGYLNPSAKTAKLTFHTVNPVKITDILSGKTISVSSGEAEVEIPCGGFIFLDVELQTAL